MTMWAFYSGKKKSPHLEDFNVVLSISHVAPDFLALYLPASQFFCTHLGEMPRILAASVAVMICSSAVIIGPPYISMSLYGVSLMYMLPGNLANKS